MLMLFGEREGGRGGEEEERIRTGWRGVSGRQSVRINQGWIR